MFDPGAHWSAAAVVILAAVTACAADQGVSSTAAQPSPTTPGETTLPPPSGAQATPDNTDPGTSEPATTEPSATAPATTPAPTEQPESSLPAISEPQLLADIPIGDVVNVDANKPVREYDPFVAVAVADIERWWGDEFPKVYGKPFEQLSGGVWAGYPQRQTQLPGCGEDQTSYQDLNLYVAFYCQFDDFLLYDDGDQSLLAPLASEFGPAVMGIVLAHEFGHAIQSRVGALDQFLPTIYTEQQADCFAGAWAGQAYRGESPLLRLGDADVRAGLIAMLEVRDPVGTDQFVEGGHGSAFDRVGAFQEGFDKGAQRCSELLDNPLPLMPNQFQSQQDFEREGNASYDCSDDPDPDCTPAPKFLSDDLNNFWQTELGSKYPALTEIARDNLDSFSCSDGVRLDSGRAALPLAERGRVRRTRRARPVSQVRRLHARLLLRHRLGRNELRRSTAARCRASRARCSTTATRGPGSATSRPTPTTGNPTRTGDRDGDGVADIPVTSSPGDLDEAIRMAILFGDDGRQRQPRR